MSHRSRHACIFLKGRCTRDHLVQDDRERIQISAVIDISATSDLLWRHIRRCTKRMPCDSVSFVDLVKDLGDTKIHDHRRNLSFCLSEQQIAGLEIPMDDLLGVSVVHPLQQRLDNRQKNLWRCRKVLCAQPLRQGQAIHPIHHKAKQALLFHKIKNTNDIRVLEAKLDTRFHSKAVLHDGF